MGWIIFPSANLYVEIFTLKTSECECIWSWGLYRDHHVKMIPVNKCLYNKGKLGSSLVAQQLRILHCHCCGLGTLRTVGTAKKKRGGWWNLDIENSCLQTKEKGFKRHHPSQPLDLGDLHPVKTWENKFLLFIPPSLWNFVLWLLVN